MTKVAPDMCDIFSRYLRKKGSGFFGTDLNGFDGIPQNLVLNMGAGLFMILAFALLREKAWGYGILGYLERKHQLYKTHHSKKSTKRYSRNKVKKRVFANFITTIKSKLGMLGKAAGIPKLNSKNKYKEGNFQEDARRASADSQMSFDGLFDRDAPHPKKTPGFLSMFTIDDQKILDKCGSDCLHYLRFQRHLILLVFIMTIFCLTVALPLNYQGGKVPVEQVSLKHFSINNLKSSPHMLWVHVVLGMIFMFCAIVIMRHFSGGIDLVDSDTAVYRTVMISGIGRRFCTEQRVRQHFEEAYKGVEISEVSLAYDILELQTMDLYRDYLHLAREYWVEHAEVHSIERPMAKLACCSVMCPNRVLCCYSKQDAIKYYEEEEIMAFREMMYERRHCLTRPIGFAFVTFRSMLMTVQTVGDYRWTYRLLSRSPESAQSRKLRTDKWNVRYAPSPDDLYWENLAFGLQAWYFKAILVNISLAFIVAIYSTPAFMVQIVANLVNDRKNHTNKTDTTKATTVEGLVLNTLPTLSLWVSAVTLPSLVSLSDKFIWYWTKTTEHQTRMLKTFIFLFLMVIILPSLGATSFLKIFADGLDNFSLPMECVFSSDNGVWFVNYLCTSTFVGTALELLRLPELFLIMVQLTYADSKADLPYIKKSILWEFPISSQYAWMLLNFAIFSVFSVIFPIITVFGFLYMVFKHLVDRYNIYFAYVPIKLNHEIHGSAVKIVLLCMLILQFHITAYVFTSKLEDKQVDLKGLKLLALLGVSLPIWIFGFYSLGIFSSINPLMFRTRLRRHFAAGPLMKPLKTPEEVDHFEKAAFKEAELYFQRELYPHEKAVLSTQVRSEYEYNLKKIYVSKLISDPPPPIRIYPYEKTKEEMNGDNWEDYIKAIDEKQESVYLFEVASRPFPKKVTNQSETPSSTNHLVKKSPKKINNPSASDKYIQSLSPIRSLGRGSQNKKTMQPSQSFSV